MSNRIWCFHHQLHLIVQKQLLHNGLHDGYFGHLATIINIWRAKLSVLRDHWAALISSERAQAVFKRLPLRPLKGRWCSASHSETHLWQAGHDECGPVFKSALGKEKKEAKVTKTIVELGLEGLEDSATYSAKLGRWVKAAIAALCSRTFWQELLIKSRCRVPITNFHFWLTSNATQSVHKFRAVAGSPFQ